MTTDELIQFIIDEGEARVAAALSTLGYVVQHLAEDPVVSEDDFVRGYVRLVDAHGFPSVGVRISVETEPTAQSVLIDGVTYHMGQTASTRVFETNAEGVCAVPLVKGARVVIHIENGLARRMVVPTVDFDVLSHPSDDADAYITPRRPYAPLLRST
jgi:putative heme degradation protein